MDAGDSCGHITVAQAKAHEVANPVRFADSYAIPDGFNSCNCSAVYE
jgi:hypothetical protein